MFLSFFFLDSEQTLRCGLGSYFGDVASLALGELVVRSFF